MVQAVALVAVVLALLGAAGPLGAAPADRPVKLVVLGDSLVAGFGLPASAAFPARLEQALKAKGMPVEIANAGVSGDTASGGLARLDWSVPDGTEAVIVELGANDMLRGINPQVTRRALDEICRRLGERKIAVLIAGMRAAPSLGGEFGRNFEPIYAELAKKYDAPLYPFFLEGVAGEANLNLRDGLHPNAAGVDAIVVGILPMVEEFLARVRDRRAL